VLSDAGNFLKRSFWFVTATLLAAPLSAAGGISAGVKAGVPVSGVVRAAGEIGRLPFQAETRRFTAGPAVNITLWRGLGLETGAMYKRFNQQAGQVRVSGSPGGPLQMETLPYSATGHSWEFPILAQYRFGSRNVRPFLESGVSFNRLSGVFAPFRISLVSPQPAVYKPEGQSESRTGFVLGGGVEFKLPLGRLSAGLRYTRYGAAWEWLPHANSADLLIGFSF